MATLVDDSAETVLSIYGEASELVEQERLRPYSRSACRRYLLVIVKNRLKRIQYRTDLVDGFLSCTGLTLGLDST